MKCHVPVEALSKVSSSNVSDAMHRGGAIHGIVARSPQGTRIVGRALTVKTVNGDWAKPVEVMRNIISILFEYCINF